MLTDLCIKKQERVYDFGDIAKLNQSIQKQASRVSPKKSARRKSRNVQGLKQEDLLSKENPNESGNSSMIKDLNLSELINEWDDDDLKVIQDSDLADT